MSRHLSLLSATVTFVLAWWVLLVFGTLAMDADSRLVASFYVVGGVAAFVELAQSAYIYFEEWRNS
jgi:hypothetical protein